MDEGEEDDEEAQEPVTRRAPKGPTKEEREKHVTMKNAGLEWKVT